MKTREQRLINVLLVLVLAVAYAAIRLVNLDDLVTTDEPLWLGRSANFYRALRSGELQYTYQMAHPGVLTMWAGAFAYFLHAPEYATHIPSNLDDPLSIESVLRSIDTDPVSMMVAAKVSKVLLQTVFFTASMVYCLRVFTPLLTAIAGVLIAFDPFLSGLDSALHVDGLFAIACFAALLSIGYAAERTNLASNQLTAIAPWIFAGVLSACAWLTRATGVLLFGAVAISLMLVIFGSRRNGGNANHSLAALAARHAIVWLSASILTTVVLLPALWVSPIDVGLELLGWTAQAAIGGHENPSFFLGEIHDSNPGYGFYPLVMLWRMTPVSLIGVLALPLLGAWGWRNDFLSRASLRVLTTLGVFAIIYILAMSVGSKKFDRYILPVFPIIDLFAAAGLLMLAQWVARYAPKMRSLAYGALLVLVIVGQGASVMSALPYRLDYFNPLLGGNERAERTLQLGWGQGGKEVIAYIKDNSQNDMDQEIYAWGRVATYSYFLPDASDIDIQRAEVATPADWYRADWVVTSIQQTQRNLDPNQTLLDDYSPDHIVSVMGVPYFRIYQPNALPVPEHLRRPTECTLTFGDHVLLQVERDHDAVNLYWISEKETGNLEITVVFPDTEGNTQVGGLLEPAPPGYISRIRLTLPASTAIGPTDPLAIEIEARDPETGTVVPVTTVSDDSPQGRGQVTSDCYPDDTAAD